MQLAHFFDPAAAAIVLGGTVLATALRSGAEDCGAACAAVAALPRPRFRAAAVRAALAPQVAQARKDGLLRVRIRPCGDASIDAAVAALVATRALAALEERVEADRAVRVMAAVRAVRTLAAGAELAPVFGLAGTLISLSQLPAEGLARGLFMAAISMAVLTTLYGLLLANLVFAPLARAVERRAEAEDAARRDIAEWLVTQLGPACPPVVSGVRARHEGPVLLREVP
jgi:chemotaxis protein MotA